MSLLVASDTPTDRRLDAGLGVLRVWLGVVFFAHGWQKFFVMGIPGVTGFFGQVGAPLPEIAAPAVAVLELAGGVLLILGLVTRPVALLLALDVLGATLLAHLPNGFFNPNGVEFTMTLAVGALALALIGPGRFSLDAAVGRRRAAA